MELRAHFLFTVRQLYIQEIARYAMAKVTKSKDYDPQYFDLQVSVKMTSLIFYDKFCLAEYTTHLNQEMKKPFLNPLSLAKIFHQLVNKSPFKKTKQNKTQNKN